MQTLNYQSPGGRFEQPPVRFPNLLRYLVMLTAIVELIAGIDQFYLQVKHFNIHAPMAPGRSSNGRMFIALTLFILAMAAFVFAQFRDPQVWQAKAYMVFNFIGIPFPFAHHVGLTMAGYNPS